MWADELKDEEWAAIDLHGMTVDEAEIELIELLERLAKGVRYLRVTHGYSHGTALKRMVKNDFWHWRVRDKRVETNPGVTWLVLK